jgi:hypothetical protein
LLLSMGKVHIGPSKPLWSGSSFTFFFCVCVVLGFELRAYTLSHSTSPFL